MVAVVGTRYGDLAIEEEALARFHPRWKSGWGGSEGELLALCEDAAVILAGAAPRFTSRVIEQLASCRAIVRYGVGVDSVDLEAARGRGIRVANVPDYCAEEVSDHALALALALVRKLKTGDGLVREGQWAMTSLRPMYSFRDLTFGVLGLGRIGRTLARKARGVGFKVLGHDPAVSPDQALRWSVRHVAEGTLLEESDVLSLHVPLLPATRHFINADRIQRMKPGAVLINTARGGLVDEAALADALQSGRLSGAGLDVLEEEPPLTGSPLLQAPNLLLSPHSGWYSESSEIRLRQLASAEAARVLSGRSLRCPVI